MLSKIGERPSRLWHRQKERYGKRRAAALLALVIATVAIFAGGTATVVYAAYAPRAVIVGYGDRATSGLRGSELLEVSTSGFAENATLQYSYYITNYTYKAGFEDIYGIRVYNSQNVGYHANGKDPTWAAANANQEIRFTGVGYAWFSSMQDIKSAKVQVTVKDINSSSPTYNRTAVATYTGGFNNRNLGADVSAGGYGMFAGKKYSLRDDILSAGGVVGIELNNTSSLESDITISPSDYITAEYALAYLGHDYNITADAAAGGRVVQMSITINSKLCAWHWWQKHTVTFNVRIFKSLNYTSKLHQITLTSTEKGVTYTINGESHTCQSDGEPLTFGTKNPLTPNKEYTVTAYDVVNGKKMIATTSAYTSNQVAVSMDYKNGIEDALGYNSTSVSYLSTMQSAEESTPTAFGYSFAGWYDNAECTGEDYRNVQMDYDEIALYAKWVPKEFPLNLIVTKDGHAYDNADVTLCQNGKVVYTLEQKESEAEGSTTYYAPSVMYSPYYTENGTTYSYDIYINGKDSGLRLALDGNKENGELQEVNVYCTSVYVDLTLDGEAWSGQEIVIDNNSGTTYTLDDCGAADGKEHYEHVFAYDNQTPDVNAYSIYLNGELVQDWSDASMQNKAQVTIPIDQNTEMAHGSDVDFYTVTAAVKKDDQNWTDAVVTLCQGGSVMKTLLYDGDNGSYSGVVGSKFNYDLLVDGIYSGNDTEIDIASTNKTVDLDYYTISFIDSMDTSQSYYEQIVKSGKRAGKPTAPFKEGRSFMGWYTGKNTTQDGVVQIFEKSSSSDEITAPMTLYAIWQTPELLIGDYIKCTEAGTLDGEGTYYKLSNLVITGYPVAEGDNPMIVAQLSVNRKGETEDEITILGNEAANAQEKGTMSSTYYTYEYNGVTYRYQLKKERTSANNTYSYYLYHGEETSLSTGWPRAVLQEFLRSQIVIKPVNAANDNSHYCKLEVFGTTATSN